MFLRPQAGGWGIGDEGLKIANSADDTWGEEKKYYEAKNLDRCDDSAEAASVVSRGRMKLVVE